MLNQFLGGRYRVIQALGAGGFAKTYIAEDHHRPGHPKCTVKLLKPVSQDSNFLPTARRLFNKEAEILEKLGQHPQIPRLLAHFEENQEFYIVQEFIEGHTLSTELPSRHRWSEKKVISILQDVLQILEFVHSHRVIHRDIKPSNLIKRRKDSRLVLIDFGVVKEISNPRMLSHASSNQKTIAIGTQGYMPIEQAQGNPRLNSDLYALGMIGIHALTGVKPIYLEEDGKGEVIWQNLGKVSPQLTAILSQMVRHHFQDRYQSATEVLQALKSFNNHHQIIQPTLIVRKRSSQSTPETKSKKTKVPLESNPWIPWNQEADSPPELKQIALDTRQPTLKVAPDLKLQKTKISLNTEQLKAKAVAQPQRKKTRIALTSEPITYTITADRYQKKHLVALDIFGARLKNINFSYTSIFVTLKKSRLLIGTGVASIVVCMLAGFSYLNHRKSYMEAQKTLQQIEALKVTQKYAECVQQAQLFPQDYSDLNPQLETLLLECREGEAQAKLTQAKKLAEQSKLQDAIAINAQIPQDMNVYAEAQQLIADWSAQILQIASNKYQEGQLNTAKAIAKAVPTTSPLAQKVEAKIQQWDREWKKNQTHLQTAQKRIEEHRWQEAINSAQKVKDNDYQQQQSKHIIQKAQAEIAAIQATTEKPYNNSRSQSVPRSNYRPLAPLFSESVLRSRLKRSSSYKKTPSRSLMAPGSRSKSFVCLNNPNPKCRK